MKCNPPHWPREEIENAEIRRIEVLGRWDVKAGD